MFLNPINNYYFAKFSSLKTGLYSISIVDNENNIFSEYKKAFIKKKSTVFVEYSEKFY